jgi:hypothetical protein
MRPVRLAYQPPASSTFSHNKPATSNQPAVLFSQNKPAPAISHQPTEQADGWQHERDGVPRRITHFPEFVFLSLFILFLEWPFYLVLL